MDSDWRSPVKICGLAPGRIKCQKRVNAPIR